jgi:KDO2-lipid IV(A) lauroyltransferase
MGSPLTLLLRLLGALPLPLLHGIGVVFGQLFSLFPNRHRRISLRNLELCFPEMGEHQRARLLVQSLQETGKTFMETALMWCGSRQRILGLVREVTGEEQLQAALEQGKGVILAAPHLGSWELIGHYIAATTPITCLYKPPRSPAVERAMREGRTHLGVKLAATDTGGVKSLLSILRAGEVAGILPDQDPSDGSGIFAPFFGIEANTMTLLPRLAARSGATVLVSYAERLSWGRGYRLHFIPCDTAINEREPLLAASALNAAVEQAVRQCPTQYQWSYKRFRTRPEGERNIYH